MEQRCELCNAYQPTSPKQGNCRARPPIPILLGMAQPAVHLSPLAQPEPIVHTFFPIMLTTGWCREFQPKIVS